MSTEKVGTECMDVNVERSGTAESPCVQSKSGEEQVTMEAKPLGESECIAKDGTECLEGVPKQVEACYVKEIMLRAMAWRCPKCNNGVIEMNQSHVWLCLIGVLCYSGSVKIVMACLGYRRVLWIRLVIGCPVERKDCD